MGNMGEDKIAFMLKAKEWDGKIMSLSMAEEVKGAFGGWRNKR
jgi:hypothetical protein